ncbi:hypothetical protein TNIN_453471, partial [Trichonephila inaurata madagascariensis]
MVIISPMSESEETEET